MEELPLEHRKFTISTVLVIFLEVKCSLNGLQLIITVLQPEKYCDRGLVHEKND